MGAMNPHPGPVPQAGEGTLAAALVDIGGTLWPNSWPVRVADGEGRLARLRAVLPEMLLEDATRLAGDIITRSRDLNGGTVMVPELIRVDADELITVCLNDHAVPLRPSLVMQVRRAMAIPVDGLFQPLPGALELLTTIRELGLREYVAMEYVPSKDAMSTLAEVRRMV